MVMIHSGYFNTLKDLVKAKLSNNIFIKEEYKELLHINDVFQQILRSRFDKFKWNK